MKKTIIISITCILLLIIWSGILTYQQLPNLWNDIDITTSGRAMSDVPTSISHLVIQTEDHRFDSHIGIDWYGIVRAWYYNLVHGQVVQWWSTIPQQLLKHYRWHSQRTRQHKIQEMRWAIILTASNSKSSVLSYYLDHVPFPNGWVTWYTSACEYYFDKQCEQLFESEILFLIAIAQDGSNPYHQTNFDRIKSLRDQLCSKTQLDCSMMSQLSPQTVYELSRHDDSMDPRTRMVLEDYPSSVFDLDLTHSIDRLISSNRALLESHGAHDCCIMVVWPDWALISYNQCRAYDERVGTVDLCRTPRQTGSAIKPFIYAQAFRELWYTGWTLIADEPVSFDLGDGSLYEPKNFDNQYHGTVTLAQALGNSFNIPAIKLTHELWVASVIANINQIRRDHGQNLTWLESDISIFTPSQLGLSVWLWTYEMSPLEFTRLWWYWYNSVQGRSRNTATDSSIGTIDISIKQQIKSILSNPLNRIISFGQDNLLNRAWWFVKTGTSRKFIDGWTCGWMMDHELIVCVRVGNHDVSSMDSSSVDTAGYLWYLTTSVLDRSDLTK